MMDSLLAYLDAVFGCFASYRIWRGGEWDAEGFEDHGGWTTGYVVWKRLAAVQPAAQIDEVQLLPEEVGEPK